MEAYEAVKNSQLYQAFRIEGFPTQYNDNKTGVTIDLHVVIVVAIFATVAIAFLFVLPGFRGKEVGDGNSDLGCRRRRNHYF